MVTDTPDPQALGAAVTFLASRGAIGLVELDRDLVVVSRLGRQVEFVAVGAPITDTLIALIGFEDYISTFTADPSLSLELPGIVIVTGPETNERFGLSLFFDPARDRFLLLVSRATLDSTLEQELVRHVRARLIAEADTTLKSRELQAANRDLEQFASIVSHDLKAPMRALLFLLEDAENAAARGDVSNVRAQLERIQDQSKRMSSMLSGLLDYSSVGRKALALEAVDTLAVARAVAASIPIGTGIAVDVDGTWPVIESLRTPLDLVLRNLVDNAVKHHDGPQGVVQMTCRDDGDVLTIVIVDDGPGIEPAHRAAIFLPFRTLAPPGTHLGLGLALVQRSLEIVGGSLSLLSDAPAGRGTTIEVRWPKVIQTRALLA